MTAARTGERGMEVVNFIIALSLLGAGRVAHPDDSMSPRSWKVSAS
jgi:hypothetical protein